MKLFSLFLFYSFLYLCVGGTLLAYGLGVSPFYCFSWKTYEIFYNPFADWHTLYMRFLYEGWAVDSPKNVLIFFSFLFFFPLWIGLWFFWVRRVHWTRLLLKPFKSLQAHKAPVSNESTIVRHSNGRPLALRRASGFGGMVLPEASEQTGQKNETQSQAQSAVANKTTQPTQIDKEIKNKIAHLGAQYGYDLFENVACDGFVAPLVLATDTVALMMMCLTQSREWIADEEVSDESTEPTWFSAEGLIPSPFYQMTQVAEALRQKEQDSLIMPVVVVAEGNILNVQAVQQQWKECNGSVVLFENGKGEGLQTLEQLLQTHADSAVNS